jgi:hypothetical protein
MPNLRINQVYGRFTLWNSVQWPTGCGLDSHQFLMLNCAYLFIQLRYCDILQWHTAYGRFHEYLSGGYNTLWGKSRSLDISKINPFSFLGKTIEKEISCYPTIFTYSLHYTDPTLRDVNKEIIAVCFQNRMKVTVYCLKAKFLRVTAGRT